MSDKKHPGTAGLLPVKGSGCGIRPDPDAMNDDTGFDFSGARSLLEKEQKKPKQPPITSPKAQNKFCFKPLQPIKLAANGEGLYSDKPLF